MSCTASRPRRESSVRAGDQAVGQQNQAGAPDRAQASKSGHMAAAPGVGRLGGADLVGTRRQPQPQAAPGLPRPLQSPPDGRDGPWAPRYIRSSLTAVSQFDPFEILKLQHDATDQEIKKAYRRLSLQFHPDKNPSPDAAEYFAQFITKVCERGVERGSGTRAGPALPHTAAGGAATPRQRSAEGTPPPPRCRRRTKRSRMRSPGRTTRSMGTQTGRRP